MDYYELYNTTPRRKRNPYNDKDRLYAVYWNGEQLSGMMQRSQAYALMHTWSRLDKYKIGKLEVR